MEFTRREMIGAAGAAMVLAPGLARAQPVALASVAPRVRVFAEAVLAQNGFPGMQIALVGPGGWLETLAVGLADLDRRAPAKAGQLFQIGSITKSLTAMAVFALAARGRLDLDARVQDLLPEVPLPPEPLSLQNLLEHSSGLPNTLEPSVFPAVPGGRFWTGFPPGSRYSYCNLGYTLLGLIVERAAGMSWPRALETLVLRPIGMNAAKPVIRLSDRGAYATGHARFREDIPWFPRARLTAQRWMDMHSAAGSVAATAPDMTAYLRAVIELGRGRGGPLFPDSLGERFRRPTIDAPPNGPGARYGNGLVTLPVGGRPCLRHTGGMIGFSSAFTADAEAGIGAYASINVGGASGYRPIEVTEYALALIRAAGAGEALADAPRPRGAAPVTGPERFSGRWVGPGGREFTVAEREGEWRVASGGIERPLAAAGDSAAMTDHPALAPYVLVLEAGETPVLRLGDERFARGSAPPPVGAPPALARLAGAYFSAAAWGQRVLVHAVGERLIVGTTEIRRAEDGSWRFADPALASERLWFENELDGRPQALNVSGTRYARVPVS